jgi:OFA family oxalate/formate antiporter-like MFS transporter
MAEKTPRMGVVVTAAATGINLALGVLYAWSVFKDAIAASIARGGPDAFQWDLSQLNDPYALACLCFAFAMIPAGRLQDARGPRLTALLGGILVGSGMVVTSLSSSYLVWLLGFGVLVGSGIACGYAAATPAALKWFPPNKSGMIAGIVVAGFGLAPVFIAPLATVLLESFGLRQTMLILGLSFLVVVSLLTLLLRNPPPDYRPGGFVDRRAHSSVREQARSVFQRDELTPSQVLGRGSFWLLWLLFFIGAGAGLMVIGSISGMAKHSMGDMAFIAVVLLALGNAGGRVVAGILCDRIGPKITLSAVFLFQALLMFAAIPFVAAEETTASLLVGTAILIGFNYGANLSMFPSFAKDLWGIRNFGVNYGILFTSWGVGGFVMSRISQGLVSSTGSFSSSFTIAGSLLVIGAVASLFIKDRAAEQRREIVEATIPV